MRRRILISLTLIVVLLGAGGSLAAYLVSQKEPPPDVTVDRPPLIVRAVKLVRRNITETLVGYGTAAADRYAWISSEVPGYVAELDPNLRVGAVVEREQLLVRLDDREYRQQQTRAESLLAADEAKLEAFDVEKENIEKLIDIANVEVEITQREYDRVRGLLEEGTSGRRELDLTRLAYEQARRRAQVFQNDLALWPKRHQEQKAGCDLRRAELELAKLNVERCTILAPFDGTLDEVDVEVGERVSPGRRLLSLLDPDHIEIPIEFPVSRRADIRVGAECRLTLESREDVIWRGSVARIAASAEESNRTFAVYVEVNNQEQSTPLLAGMFVRAEVDGPVLEHALVVPRGAVQENSVFLSVDAKAFRREVTIERRLAAQTVVAGLRPGDVVITTNLDALSHGTPVDVRLLGTPLSAITARDPSDNGTGSESSSPPPSTKSP